MARNPYDRRNRERSDLMANAGWSQFGPSFGTEIQPRRHLAIQDLEALAGSAGERARMETITALSEFSCPLARQCRAHPAMPRGARREARPDAALLDRIDVQFGERIRRTVDRQQELVETLADRPREVTKTDLGDELVNVLQLLVELVDAHHGGFGEIVP